MVLCCGKSAATNPGDESPNSNQAPTGGGAAANTTSNGVTLTTNYAGAAGPKNAPPFSFQPLDKIRPATATGDSTSLAQKLAGYAAVPPHEWSAEAVKDFLSGSIAAEDLEKWGQGSAKSFASLAGELIRGECGFMIGGDGKLVR